MKTYITSLKRSTARKRHIIPEAQKHGLDFEIIDGIDASLVSEDEIYRYADMTRVNQFPEWLSRGMLAACLTHCMIYEKMLADGAECAIVLEDDAKLFDGFKEIAESCAAQLSGAEIVLLHYVCFDPLGLSRHSALPLVCGRELLYPMTLKRVGSAAAYIITREAAASICEKILPLRTATDCWEDFIDFGFVERVRIAYPPCAGVIGAKSGLSFDSQSRFRTYFTNFVDRYGIPFFYSLFRKSRLRSVEAMSRFYLADEQSPYDR